MTTTTNPPLPSPPFFTIPNINNLRDAAFLPTGLTTSTGLKIRPGILFRSAEPSKLDKAGWSSLHRIGVNHLFDLRSQPELEKGWKGVSVSAQAQSEEQSDDAPPQPQDFKDVRLGWVEDLEAEGLKRSWVPVFEAADYSPERLVERYIKYMDDSVEGFTAAYEDILRNAGGAYREILKYLVDLPPPASESKGDKEALGALIHCTAGKDRTGIFFGVLFSYLGIPDEKIAEEYNLTETGLAHIREEVAERLMQSPGFKKYIENKISGTKLSKEAMADMVQAKKGYENGDAGSAEEEKEMSSEVREIGRQAALRMVGARKDSMLSSLKMVEKVWGGAEQYLREVCGLGDKELESLRKNLLVKD